MKRPLPTNLVSISSATDILPGKAGLVTEWTQRQKGTSSDGATTEETYAYAYDKGGRLTGSLRYVGTSTSGENTLTERDITYDRSGNLLTLKRYDSFSGTTPSESLSYTYSGPKRGAWTYDAHANVTADPQGGMSIAWNALDLPRTLTAGTASTERSYLADGSLAQVGNGTTTRLYLGDMVFDKASNGTVTLESAGWEGGRLLPGAGIENVLYAVTDHLGSVRVVKDGSGAVRQRFDYYPFGTVSRVWTSDGAGDRSEKRYRFGGKEVAGAALTDLAGTGSASGAPYLDFGARLYSPRTAAWLSPDPLAEKYYGIGPYVFCGNNPVNFIDPDGRDWVDADGNKIKDHSEIKAYIFYDPRGEGEGFAKQSKEMYNQLEAKYGKGSVAMSNVTTMDEFKQDWGDMVSSDIKEVNLNYHGNNQTVMLNSSKDQYITATGDGKTNRSGTKAINVQDLPTPSGDINNAQLNLNTCKSNSRTQYELKGSKQTLMEAFYKSTIFKIVRGTSYGVSYDRRTRQPFPGHS